MEPGLHVDDLGVVSIVDDDGKTLITWRRPKFGQWRAAVEKVNPYGEWLKRLTEAQRTLQNPDATPKERTAAEKVIDTDNKDTADAVEPMLRFLADAVPHEGALPDDRDDWPVWLLTDLLVPVEIVRWWQRRPKASGLNGQP